LEAKVIKSIFEVPPEFQPFIVLAAFTAVTPLVCMAFRRAGAEKYIGVWSTIGFAAALASAILNLPSVISAGPRLYSVAAPLVSSLLIVDPLGYFFTIVFLVISLAAAVHSVNYMERDANLSSYYILMQMMSLGLVGLSFTYDMFTFYVVWELMAISSYVLVAFRYHLDEPVEAGMKYLLMSGLGSLVMLYGISYVYGFVGSLNGLAVAQSLAAIPAVPLIFTLSLLMIGFGIKAACFPFWTWLPDAHPAAPSPISAMLSGIVIKAGILGMIRFIVPAAGPIAQPLGLTIAVISALTMTVASLLALLQDDIKRLLAYSSVTNIGFILIGISAAIYGERVLGLASAMMHVFTHALGKGLAFLAAGSAIYVLETRSIRELEGLGKRMPLTAAVLVMSLLSLAGMPPLPGFWSKWFLIYSALEAGLWQLAVLGVVNSVLAVIFYLWLLQRIFFGEPTEKVLHEGREAPAWIRAALVMLSALVVAVGFYPGPFYDLTVRAAESFLSMLG